MWFALAVNFILSVIREAVRNPQKRAAVRLRLLEVRDAINSLYGVEDQV